MAAGGQHKSRAGPCRHVGLGAPQYGGVPSAEKGGSAGDLDGRGRERGKDLSGHQSRGSAPPDSEPVGGDPRAVPVKRRVRR